jgi:alpha 1,2-mannosyltransferase
MRIYPNSFTEDFFRTNKYRLGPIKRQQLAKKWKAYAASIRDYPEEFTGRGIVICAGGMAYTTCAWVCISILRKLGCLLPIEVWYDGMEIDRHMAHKFKELGVICRNCRDYVEAGIRGFAIKPFALLHSSFKEILLLDADNNCVRDPTYLFASDEYLANGAIFWPDMWKTPRVNPIWKIIGSRQYDSPEQESGQLLINKEKCWKELNLCMHFNLQPQYYKMLLGDKDTFKFAWLALHRPYHMISTLPGFGGYVNKDNEFFGLSMVQHDMYGNILFLHRNLLKWDQTKNDEAVWTHIKRRRGPMAVAKFRPKWIKKGNGGLHLVDMEGDVEVLSFSQLFGNYEEECLEILKDLRNSRPYHQFLLHLYFVATRPGYSEEEELPSKRPSSYNHIYADI